MRPPLRAPLAGLARLAPAPRILPATRAPRRALAVVAARVALGALAALAATVATAAPSRPPPSPAVALAMAATPAAAPTAAPTAIAGTSGLTSTSGLSSTSGPLGLASGLAPTGEQVEIQVPPSIVFEVTDLAEGSIGAQSPFVIAFRGARLAPGRSLRIAARLDSPLPSGTTVTFHGRNPRGGTCASGSVEAASFTEVFSNTPSITAGGCELTWALANSTRIRRAGRYALTLRWQIESTITPRDAALAAARAAATAAAASAVALPLPASLRLPFGPGPKGTAAGIPPSGRPHPGPR
jgi:hypothetical protein